MSLHAAIRLDRRKYGPVRGQLNRERLTGQLVYDDGDDQAYRRFVFFLSKEGHILDRYHTRVTRLADIVVGDMFIESIDIVRACEEAIRAAAAAVA